MFVLKNNKNRNNEIIVKKAKRKQTKNDAQKTDSYIDNPAKNKVKCKHRGVINVTFSWKQKGESEYEQFLRKLQVYPPSQCTFPRC